LLEEEIKKLIDWNLWKIKEDEVEKDRKKLKDVTEKFHRYNHIY